MNMRWVLSRTLGCLTIISLYLFALPANAQLRGTVDATGNVVDTNGQIIGRVVIGSVTSAGTILEGPVNAGGDIVDSNGRVIGRVVSGSPFTTGTLIRGTVTRSGAIVDSAGNIVGYDMPASDTTTTTTTTTTTLGTMTDVLAESIDNRRAQLNTQIASGLSSGQLTAAQADVFTTELNRIGTAEAFAKASSEMLTFSQGLSFATDLDKLSADVANATATATFDPLVFTDPATGTTRIAFMQSATPRTVLTKTIVKQTTVKPELYLMTIDTKRRELLKVIGEGMATGKLTQLQANELRSELDVVTQLELAARKHGDAIPMTQIATIATRLDVVGQRLSEIYAFPFMPIMTNGRFIVFNGEIVQLDVIAMRRAELEGKISLALAHNSLSRSQVDTLRAQLDEIAVMEVQFRHGDRNGEFTDEQSRTLFKAFDRVGSRLDRFIASNKGKPVTGVY